MAYVVLTRKQAQEMIFAELLQSIPIDNNLNDIKVSLRSMNDRCNHDEEDKIIITLLEKRIAELKSENNNHQK